MQKYELNWNGPAVAADLHEQFRQGLGDALEHLLGVANELVPLDESPLMHSGVTSMEDDELRGAVSYDTPYAVRQHEELTWRHAPGRQAKYLEAPFYAERVVMLELMAAPARRKLAT